MVCGGCAKRRKVREEARRTFDVMGGYKHLPERQLKARLEEYKKRYCKVCKKRYDCNYEMYVNCKNKKIK